MPLPARSAPRGRRCAAALLLGAFAIAAPGPAAADDDALDRLINEKGWSAPEPAEADAADAADAAAETVRTAMEFLGTAYRRGGSSADEGFDCSGFTRYVYAASLGIELPRRSDEQARAPDLVRVPRDELAPGDLVFFNTLRRTFSHVGIYLGEGRFIHAPRSGSAVRIESLRQNYWRKRFTGARRVRAQGGVAAAAPSRPARADAESYRIQY